MKYFTCLMFVCFALVSVAVGQNVTLKGRVVDAETNKPVEFANIGVVGTYMGTASDFDGYYTLEIGESYNNYKVQISAVGYKVKEFTVDELNVLSGEAIKLFSQTYGLKQVDVKADSKRLYGILKTASNIIADSYEEAYAAKVFLSQELNDKKIEAVIDFTDQSGYGSRSLVDAFENRNYELKEVRSNFDVKPLKQGLIYSDGILSYDIVRQRGNVLDVDFVDDYKLKLLEETVVEGDSVWVIAYTLDETDLARTGNVYCNKYEGNIMIRQKDYSVVRNELNIVSNGFFHAGRDAYKDNASDKEYKTNVVSYYKATKNNKYALSKVVYKGVSGDTNLAMDWIVYDFGAFKDGKAKTFFTSGESDDDFWKRYSLPSK
ncbi:MAG: carboxypeptidase-like regulatory domain-containing protein [Carboxylicivirga sp.]|jgi:hypothetical protein|nr:carboxypeptidase-like regulatory domain-containing protein [Carboxylicivirga sp.]